MPLDTKKFHKLVDKYKLMRKKDFREKERSEILEEWVKPLLDIWGWKYKEPHGEFIEVKSEPPIIIRAIDSFSWERERENEEKNTEMISADGFGILTNFENMVIFYKGYFLYELTVNRYEKEGILTYFSKEKFSQIDKWIDSLRKKEVDEFLLDELNVMREKIGKELLRYTKNLEIIGKNIDKLNEIVQRILDRFLIYRFAEDRGLVEYNDLRKLREKYESPKRYKDFDIKKGWNLWWHIKDRFWEFSKRYNGRVFEKHSCDEVMIEDETIFEILDILYSRSFRNLNVELLGSTYEKYLGYRLDKEEKLERTPEARKAGGIYYTPSYITRYIVENTIGKILDEKWQAIEEAFGNKDYDKVNEILKKVSGLKILDPACGSGSFLIQVLNLFKEFYRKYNNKVDQIKRKAKITTLATPELTLTKVESPSLNVLKNNIYGVDYDAKAAEITAVSLMLHILDEIKEKGNLKFPSILGENIKIGNSLISVVKKEKLKKFKDKISDLIELRKKLRQTDDEKKKSKIEQSIEGIITPMNEKTNRKLQEYFGNEYKTNWRLRPFNWELEFPEVFFNEDGRLKDNPGFDAVVGNPPYINIYKLTEAPRQKKYLADEYYASYKKFDLYIVFIEKAHSLLQVGGRFGFIVPVSWMYVPYGRKLRLYLLKKCAITQLIYLGKEVFGKGPSAPSNVTMLFLTEKSLIERKPETEEKKIFVKLCEKTYANIMKKKDESADYNRISLTKEHISFPQKLLWTTPKNMFRIELTPEVGEVIQHISNVSISLRDINHMRRGLTFGAKYHKVASKFTSDHWLKPFIKGKDVNRYYIRSPQPMVIKKNIMTYLPPKKLFETKKLIFPKIKEKLCAAYDEKKFYIDSTGICSLPYYLIGSEVEEKYLKNSKKFKLKYILACANSQILNFYFDKFLSGLDVVPEVIGSLPIFPATEDQQKHIITLVDKIISLKKKLHDELETTTFKGVANKYAKETVGLGKIADRIYSDSRASKLDKHYLAEVKERKDKLVLPIASKTGSIKLEDSGILDFVKLYLKTIPDKDVKEIDKKLGDELAVHKLQKIKIPKVDVKIARKILQKWENLREEIKETKELIKEVDRSIDRLVYDLYGLTEEEIITVEESLDSDYKTLPEKKDVEKLLKDIK